MWDIYFLEKPACINQKYFGKCQYYLQTWYQNVFWVRTKSNANAKFPDYIKVLSRGFFLKYDIYDSWQIEYLVYSALDHAR